MIVKDLSTFVELHIETVYSTKKYCKNFSLLYHTGF